jgi:hypothetical protein
MLLRRIRGVLTSALVWGGLGALAGSVVISAMVLIDPRGGSIRAVWNELLDDVPEFFVYTAALGGLLALTVVIAERHTSIDKLTSRRFALWGGIAGTLAGLGMATSAWLESTPPSHTSLKSFAFIVLAGAVSGAQGASLMLRVARRSWRRCELNRA